MLSPQSTQPPQPKIPRQLGQKITGLILAGGQGTRMGGVNKGLSQFKDSTLVEQVISRLLPQVDQVVINANQDLDPYRSLGFDVWCDKDSSRGPLSGFLTGLSQCETPYLMIVPCDTPFFPMDTVTRLLHQMQTDCSDICMPRTQGHNEHAQKTFAQPTFSLIKTSLKDELNLFLDNGGRKVQEWAQLHRCSFVEFLSPPYDTYAFANINTESERLALEQYSAT